MLASAAHARTCKYYREAKQGIKMLIVRYDETWETNDNILDERSVEFSVSLKRSGSCEIQSCCRETVRKRKKSCDSR